MPLLTSADFFKKNLQNILSGTLSECQTVWIQIRTDILSVLIWVQTLCKGYQQMINVTASKERVNYCFSELSMGSATILSSKSALGALLFQVSILSNSLLKTVKI